MLYLTFEPLAGVDVAVGSDGREMDGFPSIPPKGNQKTAGGEVDIPIPTKIGPKMGGAPTPKWPQPNKMAVSSFFFVCFDILPNCGTGVNCMEGWVGQLLFFQAQLSVGIKMGLHQRLIFHRTFLSQPLFEALWSYWGWQKTPSFLPQRGGGVSAENLQLIRLA